jgi:hypothetical protein
VLGFVASPRHQREWTVQARNALPAGREVDNLLDNRVWDAVARCTLPRLWGIR